MMCSARVLLASMVALVLGCDGSKPSDATPDVGTSDPIVRTWSTRVFARVHNGNVESVVVDELTIDTCDDTTTFSDLVVGADLRATLTRTVARTGCTDGITADSTTVTEAEVTVTPVQVGVSYTLTVTTPGAPTPLSLACTLRTNGLVCTDTGTAFAAFSTTGLPTSAAYQRGEYLANSLLGCVDCHQSNPERGYTGRFVRMNPADAFPVVGPRLNWAVTSSVYTSETEFADLLRTGVTSPTSTAAVALTDMPYWAFANLSDADIAALYEYFTTAPVRSVGGGDASPLRSTASLPITPIAPSQIPMPTVVDAQTMNGRALAGLSGACVHCHTPESSPGVPDYTKIFAGGRAYDRDAYRLPNTHPATVYSTNLTPHATGLAGWTQQQIVDVLLLGVDKDGAGVCSPMQGGPGTSHGGITAADANDIAAYLRALPPVDNSIPATCSLP